MGMPIGDLGMLKPNTELLFLIMAVACALLGAIFDIRSRRIPNFITLPGILIGLLLHLILGGWRQLGLAALACLICGAIFLVFWLAGGMGAGDVKLIAAVGCLAGISGVAYLLISTALAGGVMAIALALWRGRLKDTLLNMGALALHHRSEGLKPHPSLNVASAWTLRLPYGLAIAAGSAVTLCLLVVQR
jgi:prepilin peptidase CpaA